MTDDLSIEERKKKLIAQGAAFRARVVDAKNDAHASLDPDRFVKGALNHIIDTAMAAFRNGSAVHAISEHLPAILPSILPTILPLFVSGVSAFSKRSALIKPVLRSAMIAGAAAAVVMLFFRKKKRPSPATPPAAPHP
jgi:hypothetical protein